MLSGQRLISSLRGKTKHRFHFFTALVLTSASAAVMAWVFHYGPAYLAKIFQTDQAFNLYSLAGAIFLGFSSLYLTRNLFSETQGSGIPQVKLSLAANKGRMPKRLPFGKLLTSVLSLSSGLPLGKEGPAVTTSSSLAHLYAHLFKLSAEGKKLLVITGAASGLAAAFHTPLAAVVFTIEEVVTTLNTKHLGAIITGSVLAAIFSYELSGGTPIFATNSFGFHTQWHLIFYALLGLITSVMGMYWIKLVLFLKDLKLKYLGSHSYIYLFLVICLFAAATHLSPYAYGDGIDLINRLMKTGLEIEHVLLVLAIKFVLIAMAYSTGISGGIFTPILFLGAVTGYAYAEFLTYLGVENIQSGAYVLLGMTSFLVALIRIPFTAFVMLFEMTRGYDLLFPLMVSSAATYFISSLLLKGSVYEILSEYEGVHLPGPDDHELLESMNVEECYNQKVTTLNANMSVDEAIEKIGDLPYSGFPVLQSGELFGMITLTEIQKHKQTSGQILLKDITNQDVISIHPDQSLFLAMDKIKRYRLGRLPVVSRYNTKRIVGIISPGDIVSYFGIQKN